MLGLPFAPRGKQVQDRLVRIKVDFFVDHLSAFERLRLPNVERESLAFDATGVGRLTDPFLDLHFD